MGTFALPPHNEKQNGHERNDNDGGNSRRLAATAVSPVSDSGGRLMRLCSLGDDLTRRIEARGGGRIYHRLFPASGRVEDPGPDEPQREAEWFIEDLRNTDDPELVALADTIGAIALAKGGTDKPLPKPAEKEKAGVTAQNARNGHERRERRRRAKSGSIRPILL